MNTDTMTEQLACILTDDEVRERGEQLALALEEIDRLEEDLATERKRVRTQVKELRDRVRKLKGQVATHTEIRDVPLIVRPCAEDDERVQVIRTDTGELVRERPLTAAERQVHMFAPRASASERLPDYDPR